MVLERERERKTIEMEFERVLRERERLDEKKKER